MRKFGAFLVYLLAFAVIIAMGGLFLGYGLSHGDKNLSYVYVGDINVSGKTRDEIRSRVQKAFANDVQVASRVVNGVNFVAFDDANNNISADVCRRVKAEFGKGLPVVLMMHVPFYTPAMFTWSFETLGCGTKYGTADIAGVPAEIVRSKYRPNQIDYNIPRAPTLELMAFLKEQRTLKAILCGHMHSAFSDRFSETAMQYVVGGNFKGDACEILFT